MLSIAVADFESWRTQARSLLMQRTSPACVQWTDDVQPSLFLESQPDDANNDSAYRVPKSFVDLAREVALFEDSKQPALKWSLLYSVLWRTLVVDRRTLSLGSDPEIQKLQQMRKAVSRDKHKMKAFVRFRQVCEQDGEEYFVSWFEPDHSIVEAVAPFFVRRFAGMRWSILTPLGAAHWNRESLKFSPALARSAVPESLLKTDTLDDFWRVYYCSIFNPARLKEQAMRAEMPKKYWRYLPEASCIKTLSTGSAATTQIMLGKPPTNSQWRRDKSRRLRSSQDQLRAKD